MHILRNLSNSGFLKFLIVGVLNTAFAYSVYLLLLLFMAYPLAWSIGYSSGVMLSYVLNSVFVFKSRMTVAKAVRFPLAYVAQYLTTTFFLFIWAGILHLNQQIGPIVAIIVSTPVTFIAARYLIGNESSVAPVE